MRRTTTLIAAIGSRFERPAARVSQVAENVAVEPAPPPVESLPEWAEALRRVSAAAQRRAAIYTLLTGDPLAPVVREWERRLNGEHSDLELAIGLVAEVPLPDFYLVDPEITAPVADWYLDHLARLAPRRVVLAEPTETAVLDVIRHLPYGRSLPDVAEVAATARTYVPVPAIDSIVSHRPAT